LFSEFTGFIQQTQVGGKANGLFHHRGVQDQLALVSSGCGFWR
jgi:hypothetical protein